MDRKRRRSEDIESDPEKSSHKLKHSTALVSIPDSSTALITTDETGASHNIKRSSSLEAPNLLLSGHKAAVTAVSYSSLGDSFLSASKDKSILIWSVGPSYTNIAQLKGHKSAVLDARWTLDNSHIVSVSADNSGGVWDVETCTRVRTLASHTRIVNSLDICRVGPTLVSTVSDDRSLKIWDTRSRNPVMTFYDKYPLLCVSFGNDAETVYTSGVDPVIKQWDLRKHISVSSKTEAEKRNSQKKAVSDIYMGHNTTVTSLSLSPDGNNLASHSVDGAIQIWNSRPFVPGQRLRGTLFTVPNHVEQNLIRLAWQNLPAFNGGSTTFTRLAAGGADGFVRVFDVDGGTTSVFDNMQSSDSANPPTLYSVGNLSYMLPGHSGAVSAVAFSPKEPIIASGSNDKSILVGELI